MYPANQPGVLASLKHSWTPLLEGCQVVSRHLQTYKRREHHRSYKKYIYQKDNLQYANILKKLLHMTYEFM